MQNSISGSSLETTLLTLQIHLKLDRIDLATKQYQKLQKMDEDSILCQLASVYLHLAQGQAKAGDAIHTLNSLTEQYGSCPQLANLLACALLQQGDYSGAEQALQEALQDTESVLPDTLINLIVASVQQNKPCESYITQLQQNYPWHPFCAGLERVTSAFDREAVKYHVA